MEELGEYPIAGMFPDPVSVFSIEFYGASGKGNVYINTYKSDGTLIGATTLTNVEKGPYYFSADGNIIAGFSMHNSDYGGIAIYEIQYGLPAGALPPYFLDNFGP